MGKLEQPNWGYFAAVFPVAVFGLGLIFMNHQDAGVCLTVLGLILVGFSLRPTIGSHPVLKRWRRKKEERSQFARQRVAQEKSRQEIESRFKGWEQFHAAAGKVVVVFYALRNREPGVDWESFQDAVRLAINLAAELETFGPQAREMLKPLADSEQDAIEHCSADIADLSGWIFNVGRDLLQFKQQAGLPPLQGDPPSSKASA